MTNDKFQIKILGECLNAVVNGPFIPDWEFHTLFGLTRNEVNAVLQAWPMVEERDNTVRTVINNSLNNLLGYPIDNPEKWAEFISVSKNQLEEIYLDWRKRNYEDWGNYFENLI